MATSRGKGTSGTADGGTADTAASRVRRTRTRVPEDEIGGTAAPNAPVAAAPARSRRAAAPVPAAAETPAAEVPAVAAPAAEAPAPRGRRRAAPGADAAETPAPAVKPKKPGGRKKRETYVETAARRRREKEMDELQADLRAFAIARPAGWNHDDWSNFLGHLAERGHDVSDHGAIGIRLERERLAVALEAIEGLGPKRVHALVERFQTLWSMRHAEAGAVATVPGVTRPLAERVVQQMRERYA